jgi:hypothetical protein
MRFKEWVQFDEISGRELLGRYRDYRRLYSSGQAKSQDLRGVFNNTYEFLSDPTEVRTAISQLVTPVTQWARNLFHNLKTATTAELGDLQAVAKLLLKAKQIKKLAPEEIKFLQSKAKSIPLLVAIPGFPYLLGLLGYPVLMMTPGLTEILAILCVSLEIVVEKTTSRRLDIVPVQLRNAVIQSLGIQEIVPLKDVVPRPEIKTTP